MASVVGTARQERARRADEDGAPVLGHEVTVEQAEVACLGMRLGKLKSYSSSVLRLGSRAR